jgi:hypothetical protein
MRVDLGITGSGGLVGEGSGHEPLGVDLEHPAPAGPGEGGVVLQEAQRGPHSAVVGGPHLRGRLGVAEGADQ